MTKEYAFEGVDKTSGKKYFSSGYSTIKAVRLAALDWVNRKSHKSAAILLIQPAKDGHSFGVEWKQVESVDWPT